MTNPIHLRLLYAAGKYRFGSEERDVRRANDICIPPVEKSISGGREMMFFGSDRFEQMAFAIGKRWEGPNPQRSRL